MGLLRGVRWARRRVRGGRILAQFERGEVLLPCSGTWGGSEVRTDDPAVEIHHDAIYAPRESGLATHDDAGYGLYRSDRTLIEACTYRRGPGPIRVGMSDVTPLDPGGIARAPDALYVYVGLLHRHFGHFLISGLSRFWPRLRARGSDVRLLYHGDDTPEQLFERPYTAAILTALGIAREDLVRFTEPVVLPEVLVPGPSFEESLLGHAAHARLGAEIGRQLLGPEPVARESRPVFLTRVHLEEGVRRFADEPDIVEALEARGVRIVSPETLPLAEQVRLYETHPLVIAVLGSALHTSLLAPGPANIMAIQHQAIIPSDYDIVDRLKGNRAEYLWAQGDSITTDVATTGFQVDFRLRNPAATIDALLRQIDSRMDPRPRTARGRFASPSSSADAVAADPAASPR